MDLVQSNSAAEVMELPEGGAQHRQHQMQKIEELELRREMRDVVVPVIDEDVRALLRRMGEPITLFGEKQIERRERLRKLLATATDEEKRILVVAVAEQDQGTNLMAVSAPIKELFYTEGPPQLKTARIEIARYSLQRASRRIAAQKEQRDASNDNNEVLSRLEQRLRTVSNQTSEVADERPVVSCHFSRNGSLLATGSWSGTVKLWAVPSYSQRLSFKAHSERLTAVVWHPAVDDLNTVPPPPLALATGCIDMTARLWSADGKLLRTLQGHTDRLGRISFHPSGRFLGTASFDLTWRFWEVETGQCLVEQEGHSRPVYAVAFQNDGALAVSGGLDAYGRVWDLRTGRSVMLLEGHVKGVMAVDFSPNGYMVATGSEDHSARVFDLRKKGPIAVLPGHNSLVSQVRFEPEHGRYLLTSGYDNVSKLWCGSKFRLTKTLAGHEGKVMGSDVSPSSNMTFATAGYDRTLKIWCPEEVDGVL